MARTLRTAPTLLTFCVALAASAPCSAQDYFVTSLLLEGRLGVSLVDAVAIEKRLGQLMIVNVDGFGVSGPLAVSRGYLDMVERLQVGAVIPHYGRQDPSAIRATNRELEGRTELPLLVASDIVTLRAADGSTATFGDGYVGGFIGRHRALDDRSFARLAELNAFVCRALGMSCALWPTVDSSTRDERVVERATVLTDALTRYGVLVTLKHWPFVPQGVDLHRESVDSAFSVAEIELMTAAFDRLAGRGDLLMTTHVYDSLVDAGLVTLSPGWIAILRRSVEFTGPVITDGLFMLRSHRDRAPREVVPGFGTSGDDEIAGWAARAILAGHDAVIVEGTAATSLHVFRRLLELACRDDTLGSRMRERVRAAYDTVVVLKERRRADLDALIDVPPALLDRAIGLVARGREGLQDDAAYAILSSGIAAACRSLPSWRDP